MATFTAKFEVALGDAQGSTVEDTITLEKQEGFEDYIVLVAYLEKTYDGCIVLDYNLDDPEEMRKAQRPGRG